MLTTTFPVFMHLICISLLYLLQVILPLISESTEFANDDISEGAIFSMVGCIKYNFEILDKIVANWYPSTTGQQDRDELSAPFVNAVFLCLTKRLCWLSSKLDINQQMSLFTKDHSNFVSDISSKLTTLLLSFNAILFGDEFHIKSDDEIQVSFSYFNTRCIF